MPTYSPNHPQPTAAPATGKLRAGAGRHFVPPAEKKRPLTGYGPITARLAKWADDTLRIRALMLDDGAGHRCALVTADMWAGSSLVLELAAKILLEEFPDTHIGRDQLFFSGTHTHCSPGGCYESPYFARLPEGWPFGQGFNLAFTESVARAVATAVNVASQNARDATIQLVKGTFKDWTINRSFAAYLTNPNAPTGVNADNEDEQRKAVETDVPMIVARDAGDGGLIGLFGTVSCHAASLGMNITYADGDFIGHAARQLETEYDARPNTDAPVVIALGAGAIGDSDPQPPSLTRKKFLDERKSVGAAAQRKYELTAALAQSLRDALERPPAPVTSASFETLQASVRVADTQMATYKMPEKPKVGAAVMAGSELGRGVQFLAPEGTREPVGSDDHNPHWPKRLGHFASLLASAFFDGPGGVKHSSELNLSVFKLGVAWLVGLPGEPTTQLSRNLMNRLAQLPNAAPIVICGVNGGYNGYFVTEREHEAQHYEGASCIWGRHTEKFLGDKLEALAKGTLTDAVKPSLSYEEDALHATPASRARDAGLFMVKHTNVELGSLKVGTKRFEHISARAGVSPGKYDLMFLLPRDLLGQQAAFTPLVPGALAAVSLHTLPVLTPLAAIPHHAPPPTFTLEEDTTLTW